MTDSANAYIMSTDHLTMTDPANAYLQDGLHGFVEPFWIVVEDSDSEYVLHHEFFLLKKQFMDDDHTVAFTVPHLRASATSVLYQGWCCFCLLSHSEHGTA